MACTPEVEWTSWWVSACLISGPVVHGGSGSGLTREPMNQAFFQRSSTPAIGQGSNALLAMCLFTKTSVGRIVLTAQKTNIARSAREPKLRTGDALLRAEKIGDLITADQKVLNEGGESRKNHRYAVVVQGLATHWIQSYP